MYMGYGTVIELNERENPVRNSLRSADQLRLDILDASGQLRDVNEETERNDEDVKECMAVLSSAEAVEALEELNKTLQRKTQLSQQLDLASMDEHQGWRIRCKDLLEMEAACAEREQSVTTQCLDMEKSLANAQSHCEIAKLELQTLRLALTEKQTNVTLPKDKTTRSRKKK